MLHVRRALLVLAIAAAPGCAAAQSTPADYLARGEAVDRALGANAELTPPPVDTAALPPPAPPPLWYWRQPFDQQPFFATHPGTSRCVPIPGGLGC